jgi:hypothetical protein
MILTFLALMAGLAQDGQATQSQSQPAQPQAVTATCSMTPEGYVCRFPALPIPDNAMAVPMGVGPQMGAALVEPRAVELVPTRTPEEIAEAQRQERLINRCADAPWYSLCLPEDRREARRLRDAAVARAALRGEVTRLLSEEKCVDAVRTALAGGDMDLAREARDFCEKP